jgi:hypothetical protein
MGKKPEVAESDSNIFADLGIDNADEFYTRLSGRSGFEAPKRQQLLEAADGEQPPV